MKKHLFPVWVIVPNAGIFPCRDHETELYLSIEAGDGISVPERSGHGDASGATACDAKRALADESWPGDPVPDLDRGIVPSPGHSLYLADVGLGYRDRGAKARKVDIFLSE
jgi:hypothetical protein